MLLMSLSALTMRQSLIKPTLIPPPCSPNALNVPGNFDSASIAMPAAAPGGPKSARVPTSASMIWLGASNLFETTSMQAFSNRPSSKRDVIGRGLHDRQPHRHHLRHP